MKEIVIKVDDKTYEDILIGRIYSSPRDVPQEAIKAIRNGNVLPKGHTELIDTKKLIQSVARSTDNMKDNGVAPIFDVHEITNMVLSQEVIIEADKGEPE